MRSALILLALIVAAPAAAHDSWISRGGYRNPAGEWCCGDNDCRVVQEPVTTLGGWLVLWTPDGKPEYVPFDEAAPAGDGQLWICRRPDGSRRCVFGPQAGNLT